MDGLDTGRRARGLQYGERDPWRYGLDESSDAPVPDNVDLAMDHRYRRVYKTLRMTKLPHDPEAWNRAMAKAVPPFLLGLVLSFEIPTLVVGALIGARIESDPFLRLLPWNFPMWYFQYGNEEFRSPQLTATVHGAMHAGIIAYNITIVLTTIASFMIFNHWRTIRTGLDTPYGDARFATIEDLAYDPLTEKPEDSPLPPGYDIYRGFPKEQRQGRNRRAARAQEMLAQRSIFARESEHLTSANSAGGDQPLKVEPNTAARLAPQLIIVPQRPPEPPTS